MKKLITISCISLGLLAGASFADDDRYPMQTGTTWLTIPQVYDKVESAGYRNIEEIERDNGYYEIKATDSTGQRVKLYVDPQTGAVLGHKQRGDRYGRSKGQDKAQYWQQNGVDCTKRRCRDDLPQSGTAQPPVVQQQNPAQ